MHSLSDPQPDLTKRGFPTSRLAFAVLCGFTLLLPFGLALPGTPSSLKADEPAYYMMAMSLAFDHDVRLEAEDTERLFEEFSVRRTRNLVIMSTDGWQSIYYGKPHLYSLLAAPFARLAGYRGILAFNMLLLLGMVWMLARYCRYAESSGQALLFAAAFFLLSTTWNYAFWIQPEILTMFGVCGALFFGLRRPESRASAVLTAPWMAATSGGMLAIAVYNKPYVAPLALVLLFGALHHAMRFDRSAAIRWFATWTAGLLVTLSLAAGSAWLLTGSPSPYLGVARDSTTVCEPGAVPLGPKAMAARSYNLTRNPSNPREGLEPPSVGPQKQPPKTANDSLGSNKSFGWIFRIPPVTIRETFENLIYFLIGRHTGLLLYFPFVGVAILLFLLTSLSERRTTGAANPLQVERWTLLVTSLGIGIFLLVFISWNWQGGGGFLGNRYFVVVVPAFGFLVSRLRPIPLFTGALVAGLLLGPSLISPLGLSAPEPTLQAHTRSRPLSLFPLELTLLNVPGYYTEPMGGFRLRARKDQWLRRGEAFWTQGMQTTDIVVLSTDRVGTTAFLVTGVTDQEAEIGLGFAGDQQSVLVAKGQSQVVELTPNRHRRRYNPDHQIWTVYPLTITSNRGKSVRWQVHMPPNPCPSFARNDVFEASFFAGAQISVLGPAARLSQNVYGIRWGEVVLPNTATTDKSLQATVTATNTSQATWPARGGSAQVKFSYHWLDAAGERTIETDGRRTSLPTDIAPSQEVKVAMQIDAPHQPGTYTLEIDPVFEYVGWFRDHGVRGFRQQIEVLPAALPVTPAEDPALFVHRR